MSLSLTGPGCPVFFDRNKQREQLAEDVEAFLRSGGVIRQLPPGKDRERVSLKRLEVMWGIRQQV